MSGGSLRVTIGDNLALVSHFNSSCNFIMSAIINSRAKLTPSLSALCDKFSLNYRTIFSVNPKTEKSQIQTYILHLAPADQSGRNVCPGAGNCKSICLHFAGNPVYMGGKQQARIRRTLAYFENPQLFVELLILGIFSKQVKHKGENLAIRLNGTSDIKWEVIDVTITEEFARLCRIKFNKVVPIGKRNIFEIFNNILNNCGGDSVTFYDYTKIKHNWAECDRLGYDLTVSYDGANNSANLKLCSDAIRNGLNVAAAFNIKKSTSKVKYELPLYVGSEVIFTDDDQPGVLAVIDGDLSDYRPGDIKGGHIVGLRFKLPHGVKYTHQQKELFCMAGY